MRRRLDEQLEYLNREMITMGAMCEDAVACAMKVLLSETMSEAVHVEHLEQDIDQKQREIENICMKVLLQQQPVAGDLRKIRSAIHMCSDMERIGDHAQDIAEIAKYCKENELKYKIGIQQMAEEAEGMLTQSVDAFVRQDVELAERVIQADDTVDQHFDRIWKELLSVLREDREQERTCFDLLMIAKYLERVGDHATNLAEQVIAMQ